MSRSMELWTGLRSLIRLYDKKMKKVCTEHELSLVEADVISFLRNNPGKDTAVDIVELRGLSKGAVSKAVESLIRKSFLERIPDTEDRRRIHLKLKPEAEPVTEMIDEVKEEFLNTVLGGFTSEELEAHSRFFQRVFDNTRRELERRDK